MFESATLTAAPASTRLWSACAGVTGQLLIVGCMLLAPLVSPAVLPNLRSYVTALEAPGPPPPPPPPPTGSATVQPRFTKATRACAVCTPVRVPDRIEIVKDDFPPAVEQRDGVTGGVEGGVRGGVDNGVLGSILRSAAAPPPPRPVVDRAPDPVKPAAAPIERVRAGGLVKLAAPVFHPDPIYPQLARTARVEGVVVLEGVIGVDGRIHDLKVKSGHPFLAKAAMDAVAQWVYTPATLNGNLVEVIAPITITFRLAGR
jgi:protein TonB